MWAIRKFLLRRRGFNLWFLTQMNSIAFKKVYKKVSSLDRFSSFAISWKELKYSWKFFFWNRIDRVFLRSFCTFSSILKNPNSEHIIHFFYEIYGIFNIHLAGAPLVHIQPFGQKLFVVTGAPPHADNFDAALFQFPFQSGLFQGNDGFVFKSGGGEYKDLAFFWNFLRDFKQPPVVPGPVYPGAQPDQGPPFLSLFIHLIGPV